MRTKQLLAFITVCLVLAGCKKEPSVSDMQKYIGLFNGREQSCSVSTTGAYSIRIGLDGKGPKCNVYNVWGAQENCKGVINTDGNLYINTQAYNVNNTISGRGMVVNGKLRIAFSISGQGLNGKTDNCIWVQD